VPERLYVPFLLQRDGLAGYEPGTLACFLALIEEHGGPVLDIGANVGVFSLVAAAATDAQVVAFEPTPDLAVTARAIADVNGLSFPVEEVALGAEDGQATLHLSDVTDSSNSLLPGFRPSSRSVTVPVERLDGWCDRTGTVPAVVKIDTEATEPQVVAGARRLLTDHRPHVICEVLARRTEADLERAFGELGYRWYQITDEVPLVARREVFGDRAYRFTNWLFAPDEPTDAFWSRLRRWHAALSACTPLEPRRTLLRRARGFLSNRLAPPPVARR
jgi:FkbM family methyltransferase